MRIQLASLARQLAGGRNQRASQTRVIADIAGMDVEQVARALTELEQAPATWVLQELRLHLLRRWASLDPRAAWDYTRNHQSEFREVPGFGTIEAALLQRWSVTDPAAALQAWNELGPQAREDDRNRWALRLIFSALGRQDLDRAMALADTLNPVEKSEAVAGLAAFAADARHRDALLGTLSSLPSGDLRTRALAEALASWSQKQPTEAIQWLDASTFDRNERGSIEEQLATQWLHQDQRGTADWLLSRADSPTRRARRLEMIVTSWGHVDPTACGQWLIAQGLDADAAVAMRLYANTVAANFPVEAVAWARSIPDEAMRQRALAELEGKLRQLYPNRVDELLGRPGNPSP
ncbi:MAG: hypothetical protein HY674_14755 [Chloroflexi bacterium]|nr:hypothetical protein [Chloroflexota bacterium]